MHSLTALSPGPSTVPIAQASIPNGVAARPLMRRHLRPASVSPRQARSSHRLVAWVVAGLVIAAVSAPGSIIAADTAASADPPAGIAAELDAYCRAAAEVLHFQGVVLVARDGTPILEKGYGFASRELGVMNTPQTRFLIASVTKQFTAAAIMHLEERGKLSLQDPITRHLPSYPGDPGDRITVHHLLTHTSGIPNYLSDPEIWARISMEIPISELVDSFSHKPLDFEPGTDFGYSNSGYVLLGLIIEAASGQTYAEYLRESIFQPLGMDNSGYGCHSTIIPNLASGHETVADEWRKAGRIAMSLAYSAGALYSTASDLLKWDQALYGNMLLTESSREKMFTPVLEGFGYGWVMREVAGRRAIHHGGGMPGFTSHIGRYPDDGLTVIVLSNNDSAAAEPLGFSLARVAFGEPYDLPVRKTPIEIDSSILDDYQSAYMIEEGNYRVIRRDDEGLTSQRSGGPVTRIFPEAEDRFYYASNNAITITFIRGSDGRVTASLMRQEGVETRHEALTGVLADSLLAQREAVHLDPAILERYVGEYELAPGFTITFRSEESRLFSRATGQEEVEVYPSSETEFFLKVVEAEIAFELDAEGNPTGLVLTQSGREMPARRVR